MANPRLEISIGAEIRELRTALASAQQSIQRFGQQAEQANTRAAKSADQLRGAFGGIAGQLGGLLAGFASFATVASLARIADDATRLRGQLDLATQSAEDFAEAQRATFEIAQRTRSSLESTVALFSRISRATEQTNISTRQVLGLTEVIAQAGQLSQTSAGSIEAAFFQLSQGLSSGQLRGEELNSVLEGTPRLARAIQDGFRELGVDGADNLRKLAEDGQLTTSNVLAALATQQETLREEFERLPVTISGAFTQLKNSFTLLVGETDRAAGSSSALAQNISTLATFLGNYAQAQQGAASATGQTGQQGQFLVSVVRVLGSAFQGVVFVFQAVGKAIGAVGAIIAASARKVFDLGALVQDYLTSSGDALAAFFRGDFAGARAIRDGFLGRANAQLRGNLAEGQAIVDGFLEDLNNAALDTGAAINALWDTSADQQGATDLALDAKAVADALKGANPPAKALADALNTNALALDATKRRLEEIEQLYRENQLSIAEYFRQRLELQRESLRLEIAQAEAEARKATTQDARTNALTRVAQLERELGALGPANAREQSRAYADLERQLDRVRDRLREVRGGGTNAEAGDAAASRVEDQFRDLRARLEAEGDGEGISLVDALVSEERLAARLDDAGTKVRDTIARLREEQSGIADLQQLGGISESDAETQLQAARETSLQQLRDLRAELEAYYNTAEGRTPQVAAAIRSLDVEYARIQQSQDKFTQGLKDAAQQGLENFFLDIATGAKSLKDAVLDLARNFVRAVAQMVAQELALRTVRALLGVPGGGGGGVSAPVNHSGGMVGTGPRRMVSPLVFAGAPRYHSGGMVGLKPGEVPSILQTGEEVLSRTDPRNAANGGRAGAGTGVRIVNVVDPSMVGDFLQSAAGERVVVNAISRNASGIRQVLQG